MEPRTTAGSGGGKLEMATRGLALAVLITSLMVASVAPAAAAPEAAPAEDGTSSTSPGFRLSRTAPDGTSSDVAIDVVDVGIWPDHPGVIGLPPTGPGELSADVIDGCDTNGHFWLYVSGDQTSELVLSEVARGRTRSYPPANADPTAGVPVAFLDPLALPCADVPADADPVEIPKRLSGVSAQRRVAGGSACGKRWQNDFVLRTRKGTTRVERDFGAGPGNALELVATDEASGSAVFRDRDRAYDGLLVLWSDDDGIDGFLAEGPNGTYTDAQAQSLAGPRPTGRERKALLKALGSQGACVWSSTLKPDRRSRPGAGAYWQKLVAAEADGPAPGDGPTRVPDERFKVTAEWEAGGSHQMAETALALDDRFVFFAPDDPELLVKVLDGCSVNEHFWVFAAAATNIEYTLTVTDEQADSSTTYADPLGAAAPAILDTSAFATCP